MPETTVLNSGIDLLTGRFVPEVVYNTSVQTVHGSATAAGAVATFTLGAGQRALILRVYVANEGTGGASLAELESNGVALIPYYLPSAGEIFDTGSFENPIAVIINTTSSSITVGIYASSVASGNTVEASLSYVILPDYRPSV